MKVKKLHVYLTIVFLAAGYLLAFSYDFTKSNVDKSFKSSQQWEKEDQLRERILEVQRENTELEKHFRDLQQKVSEKEKEVSLTQKNTSTIQKDLEAFRLMTGLIEATGEGLVIIMEDSAYASDAQNPNDFIVHEQDVRNVVNELFAAGAEGISINDQRLIHSSAIRCVGPTIIVNNTKSAAPFEIKAVGNATTLYQALHLPGGVIDTLTSWGITIKVEKSNEIRLPAYLGEF